MIAALHYRRPAPPPEPRLAVMTAEPDIECDVPDWRYLLAHRLASDRAERVRAGIQPDPLPRTLDPLVGGAIVPFLTARNEAKTVSDRNGLVERWPGLVWAMGVFESAPMTRYRLEAMFVGGATTEDVAAELRTEPNFVWWYERMFFDLTGHEGDVKWLQDNVFVRALRQGQVDARYNIVWKIVAGVFGWQTFVAGNDSAIQPLTGEVTNWITAMVRGRAAEDALLVQVTRVINRYNAPVVVEEHHRAEDVALRRLAAAGDDAVDDSTAALSGLVRPILEALSVRRASMLDVPKLEGPLATVFADRDREIAERRRVAGARKVVKELSDDV